MLNKHRGEFYLVMGAIFFSMNGVIVTLVLDHMTTFRLAQVRALGTFFLLFLITFIQDRNSLKAERREIPTLLFYGVFGYAMVQLGYFIGISRGVPLSLVLIIEFTAPIWIVLWIKFVRKSVVAKDMWIAIALSLLGLILVAKVWQGFAFDLISWSAWCGACPGGLFLDEPISRNETFCTSDDRLGLWRIGSFLVNRSADLEFSYGNFHN